MVGDGGALVGAGAAGGSRAVVCVLDGEGGGVAVARGGRVEEGLLLGVSSEGVSVGRWAAGWVEADEAGGRIG